MIEEEENCSKDCDMDPTTLQAKSHSHFQNLIKQELDHVIEKYLAETSFSDKSQPKTQIQ